MARESFRVFSGKPRYRMGNEPAGIPLVETIVSISGSVKPLEKKQDFSTLTERPENALNSSRTWRNIWTELREPSVKMRMSSAKHKWAEEVRRERIPLT